MTPIEVSSNATPGASAMLKRIVDRLTTPDKATLWMFEGDSITHGAHHTQGWRDYAELFEERVRFEMGRSNDLVINCAYSGNRTTQILNRFEKNLERFKPDVVFLMIGMNDCSIDCDISLEQFKTNLIKLAQQAHEHHAVMIMQTTCPLLPETNAQRNPQFEDYMQVIRDTAIELQLPLIDHAALWHAAGVHNRINWLSDAFHPNEQGHRTFAKLILNTLGIHDPKSQQGKVIELAS